MSEGLEMRATSTQSDGQWMYITWWEHKAEDYHLGHHTLVILLCWLPACLQFYLAILHVLFFVLWRISVICDLTYDMQCIPHNHRSHFLNSRGVHLIVSSGLWHRHFTRLKASQNGLAKKPTEQMTGESHVSRFWFFIQPFWNWNSTNWI